MSGVSKVNKKSNLEKLLEYTLNENLELSEEIEEATIRSGRRYYGISAFGKPAQAMFGGDLVKAFQKNKELQKYLPPDLQKKSAEKVESIDFSTELFKFINNNFKNRLVLYNDQADQAPANTVSLKLLILPKEWSGQNLKDANSARGSVPDFMTAAGGAIQVSSREFALNKKGEGENLGWAIAKGEELNAEMTTLDSFKANAKFEEQAKNVVIWSSTGQLYRTYSNVADIRKSESKTEHADFYLYDTNGEIIPGSGISHKAKDRPESNRSMAERYAGIINLMNAYAKKLGESQLTENKILDEQLNESGGIDSATYEEIKNFVRKSEAYFKLVYLNSGLANTSASSTIAGFYQTVQNPNLMVDMIYGPDSEPGCDILAITTKTGMNLKPVSKEKAGPRKAEAPPEYLYSIPEKLKGNWFELDPGAGGYLFIRPEVPSQEYFPDLYPIFMCRFGSGGSKIYFSEEETNAIRLLFGRKLPPAINEDGNGYYIGARYYLAPFVRRPTDINISDITVEAVEAQLKKLIRNFETYKAPKTWQLNKENYNLLNLLKHLL